MDDYATLGSRIAAARADAGLTQSQLAERVNLDRSSLAKIETGKRRVSALELARIADAVGQRVEWLLSDAPPAIVSRRNARAPGEPSPALDRQIERIAREVEFLQEHGALDLGSAPHLDPLTDRPGVEHTAEEARQMLGITSAQAGVDLARAVDRIGLLAFSLDLGSTAADGGCILLRSGGIAVINGARKVGRRRLTLAHEIGHYLLADEFTVDWRVAEEDRSTRESHIDQFARALLLPPEALRSAWRRYLSDGDVRVAAVRTASKFRVDMATLARRLSELDIVQPDVADQVRKCRTTRADIIDFDLYVAHDLEAPTLPRRYQEAVLKLYRAEIVSAARAVELLLGTWDEADLPDLRPLPEDAIWKFVS